MDRATRDKFVASTPTEDLFYGAQACRETPREVYQALDKRFHFDVDLFANEQNHLHSAWLGPGGMYSDALTAPWADHENRTVGNLKVGFANPPYGTAIVTKVLKKALTEQRLGFTTVLLLPMRASSWYKDLILPYYSELWHVQQRLMFTYQGEPARDKDGVPTGALFDSIVVVFEPRQAGWLPGFPPKRPNVWNPKTGELRY